MMIKRVTSFLLLIIFSFFSCEKVVDVEVPSITPKLVIDASFEVYFDETPVTANTTVKLRLSADYFDDEIPVVTNATVFLTNLTDNTIISFSDNDSQGNFTPDSSFVPLEDTIYELTVIYNNETYKGEATKVKSAPLTKVTQGDKTLFTGKETELIIDFTDDETLENYYLFDFSNNIFLTLRDRFLNGSDYNFSYFYGEDDIELPATVNLKMSGISKEYYTYFRTLIDQSGQNSGGPFESAPTALLGNMINTSNEENFPLGYFHISETDTYTIDLVQKN